MRSGGCKLGPGRHWLSFGRTAIPATPHSIASKVSGLIGVHNLIGAIDILVGRPQQRDGEFSSHLSLSHK
jgi:hypothetical protein